MAQEAPRQANSCGRLIATRRVAANVAKLAGLMRLLRMPIYSVLDPNGRAIPLGEMPSKVHALQSFNANEAKSKCNGKRFAFCDADEIDDWFLIEDGASIPLKEM